MRLFVQRLVQRFNGSTDRSSAVPLPETVVGRRADSLMYSRDFNLRCDISF